MGESSWSQKGRLQQDFVETNKLVISFPQITYLYSHVLGCNILTNLNLLHTTSTRLKPALAIFQMVVEGQNVGEEETPPPIRNLPIGIWREEHQTLLSVFGSSSVSSLSTNVNS